MNLKHLFRLLRYLIGIFISLFATFVFSASSAFAISFNNWTSSSLTMSRATIKAVVVAPTSGTATVYAGSDGGGVFSIANGGSSWATINTGILNRRTQALFVDPIDPAIIYAGTENGLFKSSNGGLSWNQLTAGLANSNIRGIAVNPQDSRYVYVATAGGVFKSTDNGGNWAAANTGLTPTDIRGIAINLSTPATMYVATDTGVYKTTDSAGNWSLLASSPADVLSIAYAGTNPAAIFAGTNGSGVFTSTDAGANWAADNTGLSSSLTIKAIAIDPTTSTTLSAVYIGTTTGLFKRTYGSNVWNNWNSASSGISLPINIHSIGIVNPLSWPSSVLFAGTNNGVYRSIDSGASWSRVNTGLMQGKAILLHPITSTELIAGFSSGGIHTSSDRGDTWTLPISDPTNLFVTSVVYDSTAPTTIYAGTGAGVFKSTDGGLIWNAMNTGLTNTDIRTLVIDPSDNTAIYAGTSGGVFKWNNGGSTWGVFDSNTGLGNLDVRSLVFYSNLLFAATNGGGVYRYDIGFSWVLKSTGMGGSAVVHALAVDEISGNHDIYAGTATGVYKTSNSGENWAAVNSGLTTLDVRALALNVTTPPAPASATKVLLAGTAGGGIFLSSNVGGSWSAINSGLADRNVNSLAIDDNWPQFAHAATSTQIYKINFSPTLGLVPATGYNFGNANIMNVVSSQEYTISNTGLIDLTLSTLTATPSTVAPSDGGAVFQLGGSSPCASLPPVNSPLILTAGSSCTFLFRFTPEIIGARSATLSFTSNDVATPSKTVILNWTGVDPPPTSAITTPVTLTNITAPPGYSITGTASDIGSGLNKVQVSINNGAWQDVTGTSTWSYSWSPSTDGTYTIRSQAIDNASPQNVQSTPASVTVNVDNTPPTSAIAQPLNNASITGTTTTISGTASDPVSPGSGVNRVDISTDGGTTWVPVSNGTTSWSYDWTLPVDGVYSLRARATDNAGNQGLSSLRSVQVDNTAPTIAITSPTTGATLPVGTSFNITGTAADTGGSGIYSVEITVDGGTNWSTISNSSGAWNYNWILPVNGSSNIRARATDVAGNVTTTSNISVIINNPLPNSIISSPTNNAYINGSSLTTVGTASLGNPAIALSTVEVSIDGGPWQTAIGTASWSLTSSLPSSYLATFSIRSRAIDIIGNIQSPTASIVVTIDNVPPSSIISDPITGSYIRGTNQIIQGTSYDVGTGVLRVDISTDGGSTWQPATGTTSWNYNWTLPADGSYILMSRAVDNLVVNVQNPPASIAVTVDNTPPVTSITQSPSNPSNAQTPTFRFSASEAGVTFRCQLDNNTEFICTSPYTTSTLAAGAHTFRVYATDRAGNTDVTTQSYSWTIDLVRPTVTAVSPLNGSTKVNVTGTTITATFSEAMDPATITSNTFYLNNGATGAISYNAVTRTATFTPTGGLAYATTFTATLSTGIADLAGNTLATNYTWTFATDPDGDINMDGRVDIADALLALQVTVGRRTVSAQALQHGDVGPLSGGKPNPDGRIDGRDALVILGRAIGMYTW